MDPLTVAAICTLILKNEAAITAVPPGTNCAAIVRDSRTTAARANTRVDDESDREAIGRVAYAEAANQGDRGIAAVVYTIINRVGSGRFGRSVSDVLNAPRQFEPVTRAGGSWRALPPAPPAARARVDAIVGLALRGELADETGGALYFQNPKIVAARERVGAVSRGLTNFGGQRPSAVIGDHSFYTGARMANVRQPTLRAGAAPAEQTDFIAAGGDIFGRATSTAFDPAAAQTTDDNARSSIAAPVSADKADAIGDGERGRRSAPLVADRANGRQALASAAPDDSGGMFVRSNGKTSAAPN